MKFANVVLNGLYNNECLLLNEKYDEYRNKYNFEVFELMLKDITSINELFFYFLPHDKKFDKKKIKLGKEHRSPFDNIKENAINIGIFGRENVNITKLWFHFVYEEFYQHFSQDFETNFSEIELTKIVEISNEIVSISVIDTTFAGKNEYKKHYFELQGFIFAFNIDAIFKPTYKEEIFKVYNEMKDIVGEDLIFAIALVIQNLENIQNKSLVKELKNFVNT